jgi:hypothetical protein
VGSGPAWQGQRGSLRLPEQVPGRHLGTIHRAAGSARARGPGILCRFPLGPDPPEPTGTELTGKGGERCLGSHPPEACSDLCPGFRAGALSKISQYIVANLYPAKTAQIAAKLFFAWRGIAGKAWRCVLFAAIFRWRLLAVPQGRATLKAEGCSR